MFALNRETLKKNLAPTFARLQKSEKGMTLIEIIIVVAILASIMAVLVTNVTQQAEDANIDQTRIQMGQLEQALNLYKVQNYRYPEALNDLVVKPAGAKRWRRPYIAKEKLNDVWGTPFEYESDGKTFKITSAGPGLTVGDDDDIFYPEDSVDEEPEE